ncbi:hypothetical protein GCM10007907_14620 [Chitinimonas prasina]|uniref:Uncharacterized protein n=1 Tax=Chitinimonas prasina TaxID=1434937 RepID=A0ABQ5YG95_9NEIS|nr:hypothetical protein GCM10007907_14620 [Chitinimonas prasina]
MLGAKVDEGQQLHAADAFYKSFVVLGYAMGKRSGTKADDQQDCQKPHQPSKPKAWPGLP